MGAAQKKRAPSQKSPTPRQAASAAWLALAQRYDRPLPLEPLPASFLTCVSKLILARWRATLALIGLNFCTEMFSYARAGH